MLPRSLPFREGTARLRPNRGRRPRLRPSHGTRHARLPAGHYRRRSRRLRHHSKAIAPIAAVPARTKPMAREQRAIPRFRTREKHQKNCRKATCRRLYQQRTRPEPRAGRARRDQCAVGQKNKSLCLAYVIDCSRNGSSRSHPS